MVNRHRQTGLTKTNTKAPRGTIIGAGYLLRLLNDLDWANKHVLVIVCPQGQTPDRRQLSLIPEAV